MGPNPLPDSPVKRARAACEREEWKKTHPTGIPYANSNYPLTPGTQAPGADTCSRCGKNETPTHNMFSCCNEPLEEKEQQYRRNICARTQRNQQLPNTPIPAQPLFWVGTDTGDAEMQEEDMMLMIKAEEEGKVQEMEFRGYPIPTSIHLTTNKSSNNRGNKESIHFN